MPTSPTESAAAYMTATVDDCADEIVGRFRSSTTTLYGCRGAGGGGWPFRFERGGGKGGSDTLMVEAMLFYFR